MAHGLTDTDSMCSFHRVPWHGLGAVLDRRPTSVEEALTLSGLDWQVVQRPLHVALGDDPDTLSPLEAWAGQRALGHRHRPRRRLRGLPRRAEP
jgi:hypothetical protein